MPFSLGALETRWWRFQSGVYRRMLPFYVRAAAIDCDAQALTERHGEGSCAYVISAEGLSQQSVAYSFGVGNDISFELSLIAKYGLEVHTFDPTAEAAAFVRSQDLPSTFHFHPWAVSDRDGPLPFHTFAGSSTTSYRAGSVLDVSRRAAGAAEGRTLSGAMRALGHTRIDLIKLDVEGAEFRMIERIREAPIHADQLVLEFHPHIANLENHRLMIGRHGWRRTARAIDALRAEGYELFHVSDRGTEFSFRRV